MQKPARSRPEPAGQERFLDGVWRREARRGDGWGGRGIGLSRKKKNGVFSKSRIKDGRGGWGLLAL